MLIIAYVGYYLCYWLNSLRRNAFSALYYIYKDIIGMCLLPTPIK